MRSAPLRRSGIVASVISPQPPRSIETATMVRDAICRTEPPARLSRWAGISSVALFDAQMAFGLPRGLDVFAIMAGSGSSVSRATASLQVISRGLARLERHPRVEADNCRSWSSHIDAVFRSRGSNISRPCCDASPKKEYTSLRTASSITGRAEADQN